MTSKNRSISGHLLSAVYTHRLDTYITHIVDNSHLCELGGELKGKCGTVLRIYRPFFFGYFRTDIYGL